MRVGQQFDLTLHILGRSVTVQAKAVWITKASWRHYEAGITFVTVSDTARRSLRDLVQAETINNSILPQRRKAG